jgi:tRNA (uracil-5-)-methyltransferase
MTENTSSDPTGSTKTATDMQLVIRNFGKQLSKSKAREKLTRFIGGVLPGLTKFEKPYTSHELFLQFSSKEEENSAKSLLEKNEKWKIEVRTAAKKARDEIQTSNKKVHLEDRKDITQVVTPLAHLPYEVQLKQKESTLRTMMQTKFFNKLRNEFRSKFTQPEYLKNDNDLPTDWRNIVPSPIIEGYRNNCEFTCGYTIDDKPTIGFLEGAFVQGKTTVAPVYDCRHVSELSKTICKAMQSLIETTQDRFKVYDKVQQQGFWRMVKVRENKQGECLVAIQVNPNYGSEETQDSYSFAYDLIKKHLPSELAPNVRIKGLFVQQHGGINNSADADCPLEKLYGDDTIIEELSGHKFKISPFSFFQVNSRGAEVLYGIVRDWTLEGAGDRKPILLDVCCGTGTIGLFMAENVESVIGIDISESACKDAVSNAELNNISNAEYICGKAEEALSRALISKQLNSPDKHVVAVVDPPRSGLHPSVVKSILRCPAIERLVYVSCNPNSMVENAITLCKPPSKNIGNVKPFAPVRVVCVDMFPHTDHCEMIMLFERTKPKQH